MVGIGRVTMRGGDAYLPGYDKNKPVFHKSKTLSGKCNKCGARQETTVTFVGNVTNPKHVTGRGTLNADCGATPCKGKVALSYRM